MEIKHGDDVDGIRAQSVLDVGLGGDRRAEFIMCVHGRGEDVHVVD